MDSALRALARGVVLGALVLGIGGRIAMAVIAIQAGGRATYTLGGTMTVIALGAVSGAGGALMAIVSAVAARRLGRWSNLARHLLFAAGLFLLTLRGLRGSPPAAHGYFYALVAVYGIAFAWLQHRAERARAVGSVPAGGPSRQ